MNGYTALFDAPSRSVQGRDMEQVRRAGAALIAQLERVVLGKRRALQQTLICLLADGHLLIEDVPGTAKTLLAKALARSILAGIRERTQASEHAG